MLHITADARIEANKEEAKAAAFVNQMSLEQEISELLAETKVPQVKNIPHEVGKFTDNVEKNFARTVEALISRANELEFAAAELREMADKLRAGSPYLTREIHDWIAYERKCADRQMSLALVKPQGG
jgi:hypothetical protein